MISVGSRRRRTLMSALAAAVVLGVAGCSTGGTEGGGGSGGAEPVFRSGEVVRIILGSSPGGGFDTHARLLQPYLQEAIAEVGGGDVRIVVQNMPGADHRIASEHVSGSPPDGTRIIFSSLALMATNEVLRDAKTSLVEMTALGSAGRSVRGTVVRTDVDWPGETLADVLAYSTTNDVLISHPGLDVDLALFKLLLGEAGVGVGWQPVAIGTTAEDVAALLRGEIEIAFAALGGMREALADNPDKIKAVAQHGCERAAEIPDVPTIVEQKLPNADKICDTVIAGHPLVFLGPAGMPQDVTTVLRDALESALTNKEYVEKVAQAGQPADWISGEEVDGMVSETVELFKRYEADLFSDQPG